MRTMTTGAWVLGLAVTLGGACDRGDGPEPRDVPACEPQCEGVECGGDGCGGLCGECTDPAAPVCEAGECVQGDCTPSCDGRECGDDGCGGSCGPCPEGWLCSELGGCAQALPEACGEDNPCVWPPFAECDGTLAVVYGAEGVCDDTSGAVVCDYPTTETECSDGGAACVDGACVGGGEVAPAVVMSAVELAGTDCCFDFDGDEEPDNGVGLVAAAAQTFLSNLLPEGGFTELLNDAIAAGNLLLVFEMEGLTAPEVGGTFEVNVYETFVDGGGPAALDGSDVLRPMARSLDDGGAPAYALSGGGLGGGIWEAGPGRMTVSIVLGDTELLLPLHEVRMQATASVEGGQVTLTDGVLGGLVRMADVYDVLNAFTAGLCGCMGFPGGQQYVFYEDGGENPTCGETAENACADDEGVCGVLAKVCQLALSALAADAEVDGEPALSVGFRLEAVPARVGESGPDQVPEGCGECAGGPGGGAPWAVGLAVGLVAWLRRRARALA